MEEQEERKLREEAEESSTQPENSSAAPVPEEPKPSDSGKSIYFVPDSPAKDQAEANKKKEEAGGIGKFPKASATDSREAASDTLKKLFGRR